MAYRPTWVVHVPFCVKLSDDFLAGMEGVGGVSFGRLNGQVQKKWLRLVQRLHRRVAPASRAGEYKLEPRLLVLFLPSPESKVCSPADCVPTTNATDRAAILPGRTLVSRGLDPVCSSV